MRYLYAGPEMVITDKLGRFKVDTVVRLYADPSLSTLVTDVLDMTGTALSTVASDAGGYLAFWGPDGVGQLWVSDSSGGVIQLIGKRLPNQLLGIELIGAPGGVPGLDGSGRVPSQQLPAFDPPGAAAAVQANLTALSGSLGSAAKQPSSAFAPAASGVPSGGTSTTYLRGDGTWATPSAGGSSVTDTGWGGATA